MGFIPIVIELNLALYINNNLGLQPGVDHQKVPVFGDIFALKSKNGDKNHSSILKYLH